MRFLHAHPFFRLARDPTTAAATAALADPYLGQSIGPVPGYGVSLDPLICHLTPQSIIFLLPLYLFHGEKWFTHLKLSANQGDRKFTETITVNTVT